MKKHIQGLGVFADNRAFLETFVLELSAHKAAGGSLPNVKSKLFRR